MSAKRATYVIKSGTRPSGDPSKYDVAEIQALLDATDPAKVNAAGAAYNSAAGIMARAAHELYQVGTGLAAKWEGADAAAMQKALGQLYATANELYWRSQQAGTALQTYGAALEQYKGLKFPVGGASPVEDPARQQAAQKVMQAVNHHMGNAWDTMPDKVQTNLPKLQGPWAGQPYPSGPNPTPTGGGASAPIVSGGGGAPSGHVRLPHVPTGGGASMPGGSAGGHGTELAGVAPPGGGPAAPPPPGGGTFPPGASSGAPFPGSGGSTPGGMPPPATGGRFGYGIPSGEGPGSLGGAELGGLRGRAAGPLGTSPEEPPARPPAGSAGSAAAAEEEAAAAGSRSGLMGPGAAGGGNGRSRERSTWLSEDRQIWTGDEETAPGVLGAPAVPEVSGRAVGEEAERERTAWLEEERQVWTGDDDAVPEGIGNAPVRPSGADGTEDADDAEESEPDILDPAQLQELLDAIGPAEETGGGRQDTPTDPEDLFNRADIPEVNAIERLLND